MASMVPCSLQRKDAAEATAGRKMNRKRKERHDKACKIARAEGKLRPATPESTDNEEEASDAEVHPLGDDEEDASDAEAHLPGGGQAATGANSPPVYQEAGNEDTPATPHEVRPAPESWADPPLVGTERRSPTPAAGRGSPTLAVGGGSSAPATERRSPLPATGEGVPAPTMSTGGDGSAASVEVFAQMAPRPQPAPRVTPSY